MTYHPDGAPLRNSSRWFHSDPWLDFNMIETYTHVDSVFVAVQNDYKLTDPVKPTVLAEPGYENHPSHKGSISEIQIRRQAWQSMFAGAAGFTYGAFRDSVGNGPIFSPFKGWEKLLDLEGVKSMKYIRSFCLENNWPSWTPVNDLIIPNPGQGEFQKVAVKSGPGNDIFIYFPENKSTLLQLKAHFPVNKDIIFQWYNTKSGKYSEKVKISLPEDGITFGPPGDWSDAILLLSNRM